MTQYLAPGWTVLRASVCRSTAGGLVRCRNSIDMLGSLLLDATGLDWLGLACGAPSLGLKSDRRWYRVQPGSDGARADHIALEGARGKPASCMLCQLQNMDRAGRDRRTTTRCCITAQVQAQAQAQARSGLTEVCVPSAQAS